MDSARHFKLISSNNNQSSENIMQESDIDDNIIKEKTDNSYIGHKTLHLKVQTQNENHDEWFKEDQRRYGLGIFFYQNFTTVEEKNKNLNKVEINNDEKKKFGIELNQLATKYISNKFSMKILDNEWVNNEDYLQNKVSANGLNMKQTILRVSNSLNLRSLSCKIHIELKMQGVSMFTVLLRSLENLMNEEAYIVQYRKEGFLESTRLYVLLGRIEKNEFIFVKKCEIPLLSPSTLLSSEDLLNIVIEIMDFGNDKIHILTSVNDKLSKPFKLKYENLLVPLFENFKLFFMGNGDDTFIKTFMIEIFDSKDFFLEKENKTLCNKCKKCVIF